MPSNLLAQKVRGKELDSWLHRIPVLRDLKVTEWRFESQLQSAHKFEWNYPFRDHPVRPHSIRIDIFFRQIPILRRLSSRASGTLKVDINTSLIP